MVWLKGVCSLETPERSCVWGTLVSTLVPIASVTGRRETSINSIDTLLKLLNPPGQPMNQGADSTR